MRKEKGELFFRKRQQNYVGDSLTGCVGAGSWWQRNYLGECRRRSSDKVSAHRVVGCSILCRLNFGEPVDRAIILRISKELLEAKIKGRYSIVCILEVATWSALETNIAETEIIWAPDRQLHHFEDGYL